MNNLKVINQNGLFVIDSREVAEMTGKDHKNLLRDIKGYVEILDSPSSKLSSANFFIPSTYLDAQNQERPCYLLTRKGCDMVANKMTGEKGVLFTAAYVTKFEEMEKQLTQSDKPKRISSRVKPAIKDALDAADYLTQRLGVKPGIAQAACMRTIEKNYNLDLTEISKCLPPAEHETGFLNATEVGKRLGISAVSANKKLASKGLQEQQVDGKGNKDWRLTEDGKKHGEEFPYVRNGHSGYQIKWNESVMEALAQDPEKAESNSL
ncbi:Rha family transcriptional regulator [Desulfosporosinus sp. FKA]|uniref:Rha family transcriptional regulator n=1 Tax=Desulfosporosinus sp. FKA TaxID=1969834 RepID=UPI001A9A4ABA|nr:Rha family transcriptional regulator [Desulfosporosinus sp. FKA]